MKYVLFPVLTNLLCFIVEPPDKSLTLSSLLGDSSSVVATLQNVLDLNDPTLLTTLLNASMAPNLVRKKTTSTFCL